MFPWNFFPFSKEMISKLQKMNPEDINKYVQELVGNVFQSSNVPNPLNQEDFFKGFDFFKANNTQQKVKTEDQKLNYSVFETHDFVFARIKIESEEWLKHLKLYHTSNLLILEHIPEKENKHSIPLPCLVKKKGTTAYYKDGMLEIQIPKNVDIQYSEIDINEIL